MRSADETPKLLFEVSTRTAQPASKDGNYSSVPAVVGQLTQIDVDVLSTSVKALMDQMALTFKPSVGGASETELEFGLKVTAEGSVIVSKLGGEISMRVKVKWTRN